LLQVLEFASTLRRYAVGTSGPLSPLSWARGWRPPQLAPFPLLCVGSAVILLAYGAMWYLGRMAAVADPPPPGVPLDPDQKNASATGCAPAGTAAPVADPASP